MKIMILGSRRNPLIDVADIVYFINGSIALESFFSPSTKKIHLINAPALYNSPENSAWRERLFSGKGDVTYLIANQERFRLASVFQRNGADVEECSDISSAEYYETIESVFGRRFPIGLSLAFSNGFAVFSRLGALLLKRIYYKFFTLRGFKDDVTLLTPFHDFYRPSTGVFAFLHAIRSYGLDNDFILSGLSVDPFLYTYDGSVNLVSSLREHYFADQRILSGLSSICVRTDDRSVNQNCGIRLIENTSSIRRDVRN